jgi:micrococcal nuclease
MDPYYYRCEIIRVIDGDTVVVDVNLGFHVHVKQIVRLHNINAPEVRGEQREEGLESKWHLVDLLNNRNRFAISTIKDKTGKYGRYLAVLWADGDNINDRMVSDGHATERT